MLLRIRYAVPYALATGCPGLRVIPGSPRRLRYAMPLRVRYAMPLCVRYAMSGTEVVRRMVPGGVAHAIPGLSMPLHIRYAPTHSLCYAPTHWPSYAPRLCYWMSGMQLMQRVGLRLLLGGGAHEVHGHAHLRRHHWRWPHRRRRTRPLPNYYF